MTMFEVVELLPYSVAMLYGLVCVASAWSWGQRRGIPELALKVCALAVPAAAWLLGTAGVWVPALRPIPLLTPLSLGCLWWIADEEEEEPLEQALSEEGERQLAALTARLKRAPDDGAALLQMAEILEKERQWDEAARCYEAAHRASDRFFTQLQLDDARERLEYLRRQPPPPRAPGWHKLFHQLAVMDRIALVVCVLHSFVNSPQAIAGISEIFFAAWLRLGTEDASSP